MANRIRHEWFQTASHVSVSVFIKSVQRDQVSAQFHPHSLSIAIKLPSAGAEAEYNLELDLHREVVPEESSFVVMSTKVEFSLKKKDAGVRWDSLEGPAKETTVVQPLVDVSAAPKAPLKYPSSSKKAHDWDQLVTTIKEEEKTEKPEGDAALNQLFQQIYANGSEEVRRAMNKSFQESGGTVLSTNWSEVGKDKVGIQPPEGVIPKKWDE